MTPFLERIKKGETLLGDGALGTMLFQKGLESGQCPEEMNLDHPEILEEIAKLYFNAGSDIISTNTFGGSPLKLGNYNLENKFEEINRSGVRAVRQAIGNKAYIAASCGPCGSLLKPYGETDPEVVSESYVKQIFALIDEGIDIIYFETMTDINEAVLGIKAARSISPDIPLCATMTFDSTPKGFFTVMGVTIEQAATELAEAGADVVGSNCGNGIENMIRIAAEFKKHSSLPILIQSNAGLPEIKNEELIYNETPEYMADKVKELIGLGVNIIGGCCGTTPAHIAAFHSVISDSTIYH